MMRGLWFLVLMAMLTTSWAAVRHHGRLGEVTPGGLLFGTQRGDHVDLTRLRLEGEAGELELDLQRFDVFRGDTRIILHEGKKARTLKPRDAGYFKGRVKGRENSFAVMTVDDGGKTQGLVQVDDRLWLVRSSSDALNAPLELAASALPNESFVGPAEPMRCGLDKLMATPEFLAKPAAEMAALPANVPEMAGLVAGQFYQATVAIETDAEFYQLFGNASAAEQYIANLFAYVTAIYERETRTRLVLGEIHLWSNAASDPWSFTSTDEGLDAFMNFWEANHQDVSRTTAHFLSGKSGGEMNGGLAWLSGLCNRYAYGISGGMRGNFSLANPEPMWDVIVVAHELGHNFSSPHTHDYQNIGGEAQPVDACYVGGPYGPYSPGQLPGLNSLSGGTARTGNGTIMSYCHLLNGSYRNIAMTFGQTHTYGIKPYRVSDVMSDYVTQQASIYPACLPVVGEGNALTVTKTGNGTIASSPAGISCGSDCSEIYASDTDVILTATPDSGYVFAGWGGDCSGTGTCSLTMSTAQNVTATFTPVPVPVTYSLGVAKTGSGSVTSNPAGIDCGSDCNESYDNGTLVTLTATPDSGYVFAGWSGDCPGTGSCTVTMTTAQNVTATFTRNAVGMRSLTVNNAGNGRVQSQPEGIDCGLLCAYAYPSATPVKLTAAPDIGYVFAGWTGACLGMKPCDLVMDLDATVNALFYPGLDVSQNLTGNLYARASPTAYINVPYTNPAQVNTSHYLVGAGRSIQIQYPNYFTDVTPQFHELIGSIKVQGNSSDYIATSYYAMVRLSHKTNGQTIEFQVTRPAGGRNNSGITVEFLDGAIAFTSHLTPPLPELANGRWTMWITKGGLGSEFWGTVPAIQTLPDSPVDLVRVQDTGALNRDVSSAGVTVWE